MASIQERAASFLKEPSERTPLSVSVEHADIAAQGAGGKAVDAIPFSVFVADHQERALKLTEELMRIANENEGDPDLALQKVLDRTQEAAAETSIELAKYALMVFITHHPLGRRLPIPPLEEREPERMKPSPAKSAADVAAQGAFGAEAKLDFYREDADANDHHSRWHIVYPFGGHPDPTNPSRRVTKDRQGELFNYMHEQMLARYDAERLSASLGKVTSLANFNAPLAEGYQPNLPGYDNRQPNALMSNSTWQTSVTKLASFDTALFRDFPKKNAVVKGKTVTSDIIGAAIEASATSVDPSTYGSLHNNGHMVIALIPDPASGGPQQGGVMQSTDVAIRDPIFYRWHRHVDDLAFQWQEKQDSQAFTDAPKVTIRDSDIIVCPSDKVAGDAQAFGDAQFGGAKFDQPAGAPAVDTLETTMRKRTVAGFEVQYLDHKDFTYFIRIKNDDNAAKQVTMRVFVVPKVWAEERRQWIELDKFLVKLAAGQKLVVPRSSKLSSVVRKPARRPGDPVPSPDPGADPNYCDCGWPYHLLLPSGTAAGLDCLLIVMATDWNIDKVDVDGKCGSMSFCGKQNSPYPDKRPMGYPFDRRWNGGIVATIGAPANTSMAVCPIKVKLV
jgi:tyrosinase